MQHPMIDRIEKTGYPYSDLRETVGVDPLGYEVLPGDQILALNDEFFLVETLGADGVEILEYLGASYDIAE